MVMDVHHPHAHARALPSVARRYRSSQGLPVGVKPQRSKLPGLRVARARAWRRRRRRSGGREFECVCLPAFTFWPVCPKRQPLWWEGRGRLWLDL